MKANQASSYFLYDRGMLAYFRTIILIMYMKKFLESDFLRALHFFSGHSAKMTKCKKNEIKCKFLGEMIGKL